IEWCATRLSWKLVRPSGAVKGSGDFGGSTAGALTRSLTTKGIAAGTLVLDGNITPLTCLDGTFNTGEQLAIQSAQGASFYDQRLVPGTITRLMNGPISIDIAHWLTN